MGKDLNFSTFHHCNASVISGRPTTCDRGTDGQMEWCVYGCGVNRCVFFSFAMSSLFSVSKAVVGALGAGVVASREDGMWRKGTRVASKTYVFSELCIMLWRLMGCTWVDRRCSWWVLHSEESKWYMFQNTLHGFGCFA
jgi:hypothetical protein